MLIIAFLVKDKSELHKFLELLPKDAPYWVEPIEDSRTSVLKVWQNKGIGMAIAFWRLFQKR